MPSAKIKAVVGSKPLDKSLSNTIIRNSAEKSTGKFSDREESISTEELYDLMGENEKLKKQNQILQ